SQPRSGRGHGPVAPAAAGGRRGQAQPLYLLPRHPEAFPAVRHPAAPRLIRRRSAATSGRPPTRHSTTDVRYAPVVRVLFVKQDHASPGGLIAEAFTGLGYDVSEFTVVPRARYHSPGVTVVFPDPS